MPGRRLKTIGPLHYGAEVYSLVHIRTFAMVGSSRRTASGTGFILHDQRDVVVTAAHVVTPGGGVPMSVTVDLWPVQATGWASISAVSVGCGDWTLGDDYAVLLLESGLNFGAGYLLAPPKQNADFSGGMLYGYASRQGDIISQRNDIDGVREGKLVRFTRGGGAERMSGGPATLPGDEWPKSVAGVYSGYRDFDTGRFAYATALTRDRAAKLMAEARNVLGVG